MEEETEVREKAKERETRSKIDSTSIYNSSVNQVKEKQSSLIDLRLLKEAKDKVNNIFARHPVTISFISPGNRKDVQNEKDRME